jgi:hypothetical protein
MGPQIKVVTYNTTWISKYKQAMYELCYGSSLPTLGITKQYWDTPGLPLHNQKSIRNADG